MVAREVFRSGAELHGDPRSLERFIRDRSLFTVVVGTAVAARGMETAR
jgi:hypothetical protein